MTLGACYGPQLTAVACRGGFHLHAPGSIIRDLGPKQRTFEFPSRLAKLVGFRFSANFGVLIGARS